MRISTAATADLESRMHARHHVAIGQLSRTRYEIVAVASAVTLYR